MQPRPISEHFFDEFGLFVPKTNLGPITETGLHDSAERDEPLVLEDVADLEVVVVAKEVVPLVDVDSGRFVCHDFVEETLLRLATSVRPVRIRFRGFLVSRKPGIGVDWT